MGKFVGLVLALSIATAGLTATTASATTCSDHSTQAEAQRAADTRDADGDGIYCESLPCPCAKGGGTSSPKQSTPNTPAKKKKKRKTCASSRGVLKVYFDIAKYPNIRAHMEAAIANGWPRTMVLNRPGASRRRQKLMRESIPAISGSDRDEYPAAIGRGRKNGKAKALVRGTGPVGWMADVAYVPTSENRSHGATLGNKLRKYCNGIRFRYIFE